jgi:hypothetical protein
MMFLWSTVHDFEEDEEEGVDLNDALLDALDDDEIDDDADLIEGAEPLVVPPIEDLDAEEVEGEDETVKAFFDGDSEDEDEDIDADYDSFDDKDDL